jgi:hypothetical protein
MSEIHPDVAEFSAEQVAEQPLLRFFHYRHLPAHLQPVSKLFCDVAFSLAIGTPPSAERTMALRKLLEAKDCAVRAALG